MNIFSLFFLATCFYLRIRGQADGTKLLPTVSLVLLLYLYLSWHSAAVCVPQAFVSACDAACRMRSDPTSSAAEKYISSLSCIHMTGRDAINLSYRYTRFWLCCDGLQQRTCYIINYQTREGAPMDSFYNIFAHQSWKRPYHHAHTHTFHIYLELDVQTLQLCIATLESQLD